MKESDSGYISLKEAAALSGYSSDYVGQLIRRGKLPGKQIFSNVAWVTTEKAVRQYVERKGKESSSDDALKGVKERLSSPEGLTRLMRPLLWASIAIFGIITLFLIFFLAIGIDHRLEQKSQETIEYVS